MDIADADRIKQRQIAFDSLHPNSEQAHTAARFLSEVDGILHAQATGPLLLQVRYDLLKTTLEEIEDALRELGMHLDGALLIRLRRAVHYYVEDTQRMNWGCLRGEHNCTKKVFAMRYEVLEHGCRDQRPEHWRRYL
jgi:hypothetical protein